MAPNFEFVDTNVVVYAHDLAGGDKRDRSVRLLADLMDREVLALSMQVLQEFYVVATRKIRNPLTAEEAETAVDGLARFALHEPKFVDLRRAMILHRKHSLSLWDALIVQSATELNCETLWTEDLGDGARFGNIIVRNPFRPDSRDGSASGT